MGLWPDPVRLSFCSFVLISFHHLSSMMSCQAMCFINVVIIQNSECMSPCTDHSGRLCRLQTNHSEIKMTKPWAGFGLARCWPGFALCQWSWMTYARETWFIKFKDPSLPLGSWSSFFIFWSRYLGCSLLDSYRTKGKKKGTHRCNSPLFHGSAVCLYPLVSELYLFSSLNILK